MSGSVSAPVEIELKLRIEPTQAAAVARLGALQTTTGQPPGPAKTQRDTYYDTADRALLRAGLALRVRQKGDSWLQTVKTRNSDTVRAAGLAARGEWEWPLPNDTPDPGKLIELGQDRLATTIAASDLRPIYRTHVQLQSWVVQPNAMTAIEISVDVGRVSTDHAEQHFAEVELELLHGRLASLYMLALALHQQLPSRLSMVTKAEIGLELAYGLHAVPVKGVVPRLTLDMPVMDAFRQAMRTCIGQALENLAPSLRRDEPEGFHQMRVALRRLRSVLSLVRRVVRSDALDRHSADIAWLAGVLGEARDLDVLAEETLPALATQPDAPDFDDLLTQINAARQQYGQTARQTLAGPRASEIFLSLCLWLESGEWNSALAAQKRPRLRAPLGEQAADWLDRQDRQVRLLADGLDWADLEQCHALRKKFKRLRYSVEFFAQLFDDQDQKNQMQQARALQDAFGVLNDTAVAQAVLSSLPCHPCTATEWALGALHAKGEHSQAELLPLWLAYAEQQPFWRKA